MVWMCCMWCVCCVCETSTRSKNARFLEREGTFPPLRGRKRDEQAGLLTSLP